jgi:ankyrin repeat protein
MNNFNSDVNLKNDKGRNIFHIAAINGKIKMIRLLQKLFLKSYTLLKDRINEQDYRKNTPLHLAVLGNHFNTIRYLLNFKNININLQNSDGNTALHISLKKNYNLISLLLNEAGFKFI